jgi:hypothetical protein
MLPSRFQRACVAASLVTALSLSAIVDEGREDQEYVMTPWGGPSMTRSFWFATVTLSAWAPGQNPLTVSHQSRILCDDVYIHRPDPKLAEGCV